MLGPIRRNLVQFVNLSSKTSSLRFYSSAVPLKDRIAELIPIVQKKVADTKAKYGDKVLGECTVNQAYGGMRDVPGMIYETSLLDSQEGIRFRGWSIPEVQKMLPKSSGEQPFVEGILYLLFTGEIPTAAQVEQVRADLAKRATKVPKYTLDLISNFPKDMHPMTQFSQAILSLQSQSHFARAYSEGLHKSKYWSSAYEDVMDLVAQTPVIAAHIYRHTFKDGKVGSPSLSQDLASSFSTMLGYKNPEFEDLMRLYLIIHCDHEGGNVSAHTVHLVGSALSDPYLALAAGMCGLAGPLHGLANQEVLKFIEDLQKNLGFGPNKKECTKQELEKALWDQLNKGLVIPGFGHAVLRKTDPRYTSQREFALKYLPNNPMFKLVSQMYEVAPKVLLEQGKTKNPWPNVDAHSGVLLQHYNMTESNFYTVLFGVSRTMGVLAQLVWSRALGFPIERPKSMTTDEIIEKFSK